MLRVLNEWYVAANSSEVQDKPLSRRILDTPIVLFRDAQGVASALLDICPHRLAPLSMGVMLDGHLQCPYHGLEFDGGGICVRNPHGNGATPSSLNVKSFPLVEQHDLIWIWLGEKVGDPSQIPDYSCRVDPNRTTLEGYLHLDCNYKLIVDNLMDLGHAQFVHRSNAAVDTFGQQERKVSVGPSSIEMLIKYPNSTPTVSITKFMAELPEKIDFYNDITWFPVSNMINDIAWVAAGGSRSDCLSIMGTHVITPETENSCHYFYANSRNFALDDIGVDQALRAQQIQLLALEDKPMVEAVQRAIATADRYNVRPAMLACDEAAIRVSREIARREQLEEQPA